MLCLVDVLLGSYMLCTKKDCMVRVVVEEPSSITRTTVYGAINVNKSMGFGVIGRVQLIRVSLLLAPYQLNLPHLYKNLGKDLLSAYP